MAITKSKEKITLDSKNKISIITNIEVNINQNNLLVKPTNNSNNIINLNINNGNNNPRPTTMKKSAASPFILPVSQISNNSNSPNLLLSTNPNNMKPSDINKPRNLQSSQIFNEHKIIIRDTTKKRDAETQTEEIFFKMYIIKLNFLKRK